MDLGIKFGFLFVGFSGRSPTADFSGGYPSDEEWHGYINNKDRVLLKVRFLTL